MSNLGITANDILVARKEYPKLPYHNFLHAIDVMAEVWSLACEAAVGIDLEIVSQAALWHDVVYVPGAKYNEELSAQFAYGRLVQRDQAGAAEAARLIRLTSQHITNHGDLNGALLCDADLAGFAKSFGEFSSNNDLVRQEFVEAGLGPQFVKGRHDFLRYFKERAYGGSLLRFPVRASERNNAACVNITQAILDLDS